MTHSLLLWVNKYKIHLLILKTAIKDLKSKLSCFQKAMSSLPTGNQTVLRRLFGFLLEVAQNSVQNKMTTTNLAVVFGPTLLVSKLTATDHLKVNHFTISL
jgi:hypothetical protein